MGMSYISRYSPRTNLKMEAESSSETSVTDY
jgi:hypothetical protein